MSVYIGDGPAPAYARFQRAHTSIDAAKREGERRVNALADHGSYDITKDLSWGDPDPKSNGMVTGRFHYRTIDEDQDQVGTIRISLMELGDGQDIPE